MSGGGVASGSSRVAASFFAIRTPLLPFDDFLAWNEGLQAESANDDPAQLEEALSADRARLRGRLAAILERPIVRDAIFVASPDLDESLDVWIRSPDSERGARVERAIVRYFSRMAARPTPFGLFAGNAVGSMGERTRLVSGPREGYRRHSRLDMDYLFALTSALERDTALRTAFRYQPNSSLYRAAGRLHYVEARTDGKARRHHLVAVEDSGELRRVLEAASGGATVESLASVLVDEEVSREDAEDFVGELIDSQILRPDLPLFLTGPDPAEALSRRLRERPETAAMGDLLEEIRTDLAAIDSGGAGAAPEQYRAIARRLEALPVPAELSRLFQVDMVKPAAEAELGGPVLAEIVRGLEAMHLLAEPRGPDDDLARFRDAFTARYQDREVPLVEVLDDEVGIGFPRGGARDADGGPLLAGLEFPGTGGETPLTPWGERQAFLLNKLTEAAAAGADEISIERQDLERFGRKDPPPLPGAFAVLATVAAASEEALSRGEFRLHWAGADGPSGARLLGRFCHADPELRRRVEGHLREEERLDPEAVFAEIVHLPEGRVGNVLFRPVLRDFEIPFLGTSGVSPDRQIGTSDLLVSVADGRVVLRSSTLGRRVVPRLTSAHNFHWASLDLYRFLGEVQEQDSPGPLGWSWGPLWSASFLPRVVSGRLVLSLARWIVSKEEIRRIAESKGANRFRAVQSWRAKRRLPRVIILADGDNRLPVDLSNVLSVESFVHLIKDRPEAQLIEMFPGADELCARGPEGRFVHELVVPFVRRDAEKEARLSPAAAAPAPRPRAAAARTFPPGSDWMYVKLYTGAATSDRVLRELVREIVTGALESGAADRWFFIRYGDPDWHVRVRLRGEPHRLIEEVLPALTSSAAPFLADGRGWRVQLDTYEREIERYGGPEGMELSERIFQADSECALEILDMLEDGDAGADERWRITLRGIDAMLDDFGLDLKAKRALVDATRKGFSKQLGLDEGRKRELGNRFRKEARDLGALLDAGAADESPLSSGLAALRGRSERVRPLIRKLEDLDRAGRLTQPLAALAGSHAHMHANRLLRSAHRRQEFVLYEFLARLYETRAIRAGTTDGAPPPNPT